MVDRTVHCTIVPGAGERMPEDVQKLVAQANSWRNEDPATEVVSARVTSLVGRLTDALEAAYSKGAE